MMMSDREIATNFVRSRQIDSFQKLLILLLLDQDPDLAGRNREFIERLNFGDAIRFNRIITDLRQTGVLVCNGESWRLHEGADIRVALQALVRVFDDPADRRKLLDQVADNAFQTYRYPYPQRAFQQAGAAAH